MPLSAIVANGTYIVAAGAPAIYSPEQQDKLSVGPITAGLFPFLAGIGALLINAGWQRKGVSLTVPCICHLTSNMLAWSPLAPVLLRASLDTLALEHYCRRICCICRIWPILPFCGLYRHPTRSN